MRAVILIAAGSDTSDLYPSRTLAKYIPSDIGCLFVPTKDTLFNRTGQTIPRAGVALTVAAKLFRSSGGVMA